MEIHAFMVRTELYHGISGSQDTWEKRYPGTRAGYALALDRRDYERIENVGAFGNIGSGHTFVEAVIISPLADEEVSVPIDSIPDYIWDALPDGTLTVSDWKPMRKKIWNGNNHVWFSPDRSRQIWAELQFSPR